MNRLTLAIVLSVLTPVLSVSGATEGGLTERDLTVALISESRKPMTPEDHAEIASIGFAPLAIETRHCTPVTSAHFITYSEESAERTLTDCKPIALLQILEGIRSNEVLGEDVKLFKLAQTHDRFWAGENYLDINTTPVAALLAIFPSTQNLGTVHTQAQQEYSC